MSTRGFIGWVTQGTEKITYNHSDSYPSWLGLRMLAHAKAVTEDDARKAHELRLVDECETPGAADRKRLAPFHRNVSSGHDWYSYLRGTQGDPALILEAGVATDGSSCPSDSLFMEWGYVVDFDNQAFEVYYGFQQAPHSQGRFAGRHDGGEWYPVALVASWPLGQLQGMTDEDFMAALAED